MTLSALSSSMPTHSSILWMVLLIGPNSTTSRLMSAMKRPSEVPPVVDACGVMPTVSRMASARASTSRALRRQEGFGAQFPDDFVVEAIPVENLMDLGPQARFGAGRGEAEVEDDVDMTGDDVAGAGAAVHVGNLPGGRRKEVVAAIPLGGGEFGDGRGGEMDRVLAQLRISDMRLDALDAQPAMQRTASAVLHGVAEDLGAGRLADNAVIQGFAACRETLDDLDRAVGRRAFLVGGDQPGDRAGMLGVLGDEAFDCRQKCGDGAFHVGGAATVEQAVAFGWLEWLGGPIFQGAGRHDVGMPGETDQGATLAAARPEVGDISADQGFDAEAERGEAFGQPGLAAGIVGGGRAPGDQLAGVFQRLVGGARRRCRGHGVIHRKRRRSCLP
jgi:hypothetical protein